LRRKPRSTLFTQDHLGNWVTMVVFQVFRWPNTQRSGQSWIKRVQGSAGSSSWYHPCDADFKDLQNTRVMGSWRFPARFQRKAWDARQYVTKRCMKLWEWNWSCNWDLHKLRMLETWNALQRKFQVVTPEPAQESGYVGWN
jgi:hypothetical protein